MAEKPSRKVVAVARKLNGGRTKDLVFEDRAIRVNGEKQVVVAPAESAMYRPGRLPAHASSTLRQLVARGMAGLGDLKEVAVAAGGKDRAGWLAGELVVYHHPV